jgi:hypothetical protein
MFPLPLPVTPLPLAMAVVICAVGMEFLAAVTNSLSCGKGPCDLLGA